MDSFLTSRGGNLLTRDWVQTLIAAARRHGLDGDVAPVRGWLGGAMLIACVRRLGGTVRPDDPFYGWILRDEMDNLETLDEWAPELKVGEVRIGDFHGVVAIELHGETFLALRTDEPISHSAVVRTLVLAGPSLEATMRLSADLARVRRELLQTNRVMVFGASQRLYSTRPVAEEELILPTGFKRDLLAFVDGFGRAAEICRRLKVSPSRGALFVGAAGTGKTQAVRHLMTRLPSFRTYILTVPNGVHDCGSKTQIERLLEQMQELGDPGIVVIEDIDRLFETKALTPQFFLNVLDGMFQPVQPVLWIATSNDPRGFEANLLDRPGRFDRVFAFPMPGPGERLALLRRYCAFPVDDDVLDALVRSSDGLTGAHLREVCYSAALEAAERPAEFGAELRAQLQKVVAQHGRARRYDFELGGERRVGFGG
jgi:hypothetical protein